MRPPTPSPQTPDPRDRWYGVVFAAVIAGGLTLDTAVEHYGEGAPLSVWIGTGLLGAAASIALVVIGTWIYRWLRRRGYNLDDD